MQEIRVEVCIDSTSSAAVREAVAAAYEGGASTVELCRAMELEGLTPVPSHIREARRAFRDRPGLVVMIRPRGGDFCYTEDELSLMLAQIEAAYEAGADGVALGVLRKEDGQVHVAAMDRLLEGTRRCGLAVTFHRAVDATPDPLAALGDLMRLGVDRVLTGGVPWGQKRTALDGVDRIRQFVRKARRQIEVVIGGGVNPANVASILQAVPVEEGIVSVHAFSGAQQGGRTTAASVRMLVQAANAWRAA